MGDFPAAFYQVTSLLDMEDFSFLKHHRPFKLPGLMSVLVTEGESQSGLARNEQNLREQMWITFGPSLGGHWAHAGYWWVIPSS